MHNLKGRQSAQLDTFSGLVTMASPSDLPEGASPRLQNVDFTIGGVQTRSGLTNPFVYANAAVGPAAGNSAVTSAIPFGTDWSGAASVLTNNGAFASTKLAPVSLAVAQVQVIAYTQPAPQPTLFALVVTFAAPVPPSTPGQTYTFVGQTALPALNGAMLSPTTLTPYVCAANQQVFLFGNTPVPLTSETGSASTNFVSSSYALNVTGLGLSVPATATPQGILLSLLAYSTVPASISVQLLMAGVPTGIVETVALPTSGPVNVTLGGINDLFGGVWPAAALNSTGFGFSISVASSSAATVFVGYSTLQVVFAAQSTNFTYVQTFEDSFATIRTIALDSAGQWWVENLAEAPGVLQPLAMSAPAGAFASSFTAESRQYVALSDLKQGVYGPQQFNGQWTDRVSQVGPGAAPTFAASTSAAASAIQITALAVAGDVVTLVGQNSLIAGTPVTFAGLTAGAFLNGSTLIVLGSNLSANEFAVQFVTADMAQTPDAGTATPQTNFSIATITQAAQKTYGGGAYYLQSSGPGSTSPGNVVTVYYQDSTDGVADAELVAAMNGNYPVYMYLKYIDPYNPPGAGPFTVLVTSVGMGSPPGQPRSFYYFTFQVSSAAYGYSIGSGHPGDEAQWTLTAATVTTATPVPQLQVNSSATIAGASVAGWNGTWKIVSALNSAALTITQTSLVGGVGTFNYVSNSPEAPAAGQLVTITGTLNANGTLNGADLVIANVTGNANNGSFTISGFSAAQDYPPVAEQGQATTAGTTFIIDPGLALLATSTNPIYGNSTGGVFIFSGTGQYVSAGTRKGTVFFIDRNGTWTRPAPPVTFSCPSNTTAILASNIPIGPPNVVARAIALTEAGQNGVPGANFYTLATDLEYVADEQTFTASSLFINDNTSTTATFTFPDEELLNGQEIDIQGGDLFNLGELGDAAWCTQYAGRSVWGRVRTKVQNFLNLTFDGGFLPGSNPLPLGWTLDPGANAIQPSLRVSPVFGNSLYIKNTASAAVPLLGVVRQTAYQDANNVAILQNQTAYSVRVTARSPSSATGGSLVIDLTSFDPGLGYGKTYGSFVLPLSSMASSMAVYDGVLLGTDALNIPADLQLRISWQNLPPGADVEIDRIDIYPTIEPTDLTSLVMSYAGKLSSFDLDDGLVDTTTTNAQPANGAFTMRDLLYVLKESSMGYVADAPNQEPANWSPFREVSNVVGSCGINAFDVGEEWAVMACRNGLYLFNGGAPIPVHLEIADVWNSINWAAGQTICVRNDVDNRKIFCAVPLPTPNPWMTTTTIAPAPTTPNVVLMLDYQGIGSVDELMNASAIHVTLTGKLAIQDLRRKWALWTIPSPYIGRIKRNDLDSLMMFCNGTGTSKIYYLADPTGKDDGAPFISSYCTYGFVDQTKAQEAPMFGLHNKRFSLFDAVLSGQGTAALTFYQNTLSAPFPYSVPGGVSLATPAYNNTEGPMDEYGHRIFGEVAIDDGTFALSQLTLVGAADRWSPVRGF